MKRLLAIFAICALSIPCFAAADTNGVIRSVEVLADVLSQKFAYNRKFELRVIAYSAPNERRGAFFVLAENGKGVPLVDMREVNDPPIRPGDLILVQGITAPGRQLLRPKEGMVNANCASVTVLGQGPPIRHLPIAASDIDNNELLYRPIRLDGILVDMRVDEIDPNFTSFVIDCASRMIYAVAYTAAIRESSESLRRLIGATIAIDGVLYWDYGTRIHRRRYVSLRGNESLHVLKPPSKDLFNVPEIGETEELSPEAILALGRRRTSGRVLAVWNGDTILLHTGARMPIKVGIIGTPPAIGEDIEVVGYTETDLFRVNLANAMWRKVKAQSSTKNEPEDTAAKELLEDAVGRRKFNMAWNGRMVRLRGIVRDIHGGENAPPRILFDDDGRMVAADCSTVPAAIENLCPGCVISVTGVCVMDTENWNRHSALPRVKEMFISVSSPDDIKVLATPPWWTPARLAVAIGVLLLLLVVITVWNISLRKLSERRGRELFRNQIARAESELRVEERTRLAADLHDHLAQNLTAISYQIAAAERSSKVEPEASAQHLGTAARMLGSCRTELRRCLWDLRSDALDEPDFSQAIKRTVEPVAGEAEVAVDFAVPRARISDTTAHAILSIVRELTANAVNHGHARHIRISGEMSDEQLHISVVDDGTGFDPATAADSDNGHFGLDGIRERLHNHNGELAIESTPGKGTTVSISLKLNH